jgi:hypothetical protein
VWTTRRVLSLNRNSLCTLETNGSCVIGSSRWFSMCIHVFNEISNYVKWLTVGGSIWHPLGLRFPERVQLLVTFNVGQMIDYLSPLSLVHATTLPFFHEVTSWLFKANCYHVARCGNVCVDRKDLWFLCSGFSLCVIGEADHTVSLMLTLKNNACFRGSHNVPYFVTSCFHFH